MGRPPARAQPPVEGRRLGDDVGVDHRRDRRHVRARRCTRQDRHARAGTVTAISCNASRLDVPDAARRPKASAPEPVLATPRARRRRQVSQRLLEAVVEELVEDLGVALALELGHDLAHEEAALLLAGLVVAGAVLLDDVALSASTASTTAPSSPSSLTCARPRSSTMSRGHFSSRSDSASTSFAWLREIVPSATRSTSSASISGASDRGREPASR